MLARPTQFDDLAQGHVRPLSWALRVSFPKELDPSIGYFTLDSSLLDGGDVLAPEGTDDILPWDQFDYDDYSDRIVSVEWQREEVFPYSVTQAFADIRLNNYDRYFTRGSNSPIDTYLLPRRPVRILAGFDNINLPQFVGLTTKVPETDKKSLEATVHAIDFLSYLFEKPIDNTVIYENLKTHQILDNLMQDLGLLPSQYVLEEGFNEIAFFYVEKGQKFGDIVNRLMEAELGSFYMDELGVIRFKNRYRASVSSVYTFTPRNVIDYSVANEDNIINVVEIKAAVREVQERQVVFTLSERPLLGATTELFFNFEDPITSLDDVEFFTANSLEDGTGTDLTGNITVTSVEQFSKAVKVTFTNSGADAYLTSLTLYGTPAKIARNIYLRVQDDDSVEQFEEQPILIENDYIQSNDAANSIALSLLNYYKDFANTIELNVKGNYALQIGDNIDVLLDDIDATYQITKITNILSGAQFTQKLTGKIHNIPSFFTLDESLLDGMDVLAI